MAESDTELLKLRNFLKKENIDILLINSTDEYLNEYTPIEENSRCLITGFTGSTGDALVTQEDVFLFVDGRYHLQADEETDENLVTVVKLSMDKPQSKAILEKINEILKKNQTLGLISKKLSYAYFEKISENLADKNINIKELDFDPVADNHKTPKAQSSKGFKYVPIEITGESSDDKLKSIIKELNQQDIDFYVLTKLEEIAYLTNIRSYEIPFNSSFKAKAIITQKSCLIFTDLSKITDNIKKNFSDKFKFLDVKKFTATIDSLKNTDKFLKIAYAPGATNLYTYRLISKGKDRTEPLKESILSLLKSLKNLSELNHMKYCFKQTDKVVEQAMQWVKTSIDNNLKITEKDFSDKVKELFIQNSAEALSFEVISASGKNAAFIHYTNPDDKKVISRDDLILLDCGAYFEGGYATDITRTFVAGGKDAKPLKKMKKVYTIVLKAFLTGLNYDVTPETTGFDIDNAVRGVINENPVDSFKFSHGTGHGVGISVHEMPPRVSPAEAAKTVLKPGMCFTIEPGLYNYSLGGVRIENTVTLILQDNKLKIQSLSSAKLDENLIDYDRLNEQEKIWLEEYARNNKFTK